DKQGKSHLNKRPGSSHMVVTIIGGDDNRINLADNVLRALHNARDQRSGGKMSSVFRLIGPHVCYPRKRDLHTAFRLPVEIIGDHRRRTMGHWSTVIAIDDGGP